MEIAHLQIKIIVDLTIKDQIIVDLAIKDQLIVDLAIKDQISQDLIRQVEMAHQAQIFSIMSVTI